MFYNSLIVKLRNTFLKEYEDKEYGKACDTGRKILEVYDKNKINESIRYARDIFNYARACEKNGDFEKALINYEEANDMLTYIKPEEKEYFELISDINTNMGIIYKIISKNDMTLTCFEKAYDVVKDNLEKDNSRLAKVNYNLGSIYYDLKNYNEALFYYTETLNYLTSENRLYYDALNCLGYCYEKLKDYNQAQRMLEKALSVIAKQHNINSAEYLVNINYLSNMLLMAKKYDDAMVWFKKTAGVVKNLFNDEYPLYSEVLSKIGDIHSAKKEYAKAIMFKTKALNISTKQGNNLNNITLLTHLADLYKKTEQPLKAAAMLKKCLGIKKELLSSDTISYIKESIELADLYVSMNKVNESLAVLEPLLKNKKLTPLLCREITARLVPVYEGMGAGKQLYALYDTYVSFFPDKSFDDMLNIIEGK